MDNSELETSREMNLYEKYSDYTDEQILEILRNHKDYQELAVDVAVKIAVDRKLINSKQDLLAPEFQSSITTKRTLFPEVRNEFHRSRLIGSIFRFMFLMTILPLVHGIINYLKGEMNQAMLGIGIGLIWFLLCLLFKKTKQMLVLMLLFILLVGVSMFVGYSIFRNEAVHFIDVVMLVIGTLLPLYLMWYLKILIRKS